MNRRGFTIVELLVVIVVIAILAAITVVAYNGVANQARESALKSDLRNAATQLNIAKVDNGSYPTNSDNLKKSEGTIYQYSGSAEVFCLSATNARLNKTFRITEGGSIEDGLCSGHVANPAQDGALLQTITAANCSTNRIMAVDARDNRTYWVQKLADGKCWMLTNLAYAGGGTNTYGDVKTLQNGTSDTTGTYTVAKYYIPAGANPTTSPTRPSTSTDGGATNPQYGYHYNWCAAMGAQTSTAACSNTTAPAANTAISVCPAGWRLPTGSGSVGTGDFYALNTAVNGGSFTTDAGLRSGWLGQRAGYWLNAGATSVGVSGNYWSSTGGGTSDSAYKLVHTNTQSGPTNWGHLKSGGHSVRCVVI